MIADAATGRERVAFSTMQQLIPGASVLCFSDAGAYLLLCDFGVNGSIEVRDAGTGGLVTSCPHSSWTDYIPPVIGVRYIVVGGQVGPAVPLLWPLNAGAAAIPLKETNATFLGKAVFDAASGYLVAMGFSDSDGRVQLWQVTEAGVTGLPFPPSGGVKEDICFSPTGRELAMVTDGGEASLWCLAEKRVVWKAHAPGYLHAMVRFSPDGKLLAATGSLERGRILEASTGALVAELGTNSATGRAPLFSDSGKTLLTFSDSICVWDTATGSTRGVVEPDGGYFHGATWIDDDDHIHTVDSKGRITTWTQVRSGHWYLRPAWWATVLCAVALVLSIRRDRRSIVPPSRI
jgi:WD40 repeat protein